MRKHSSLFIPTSLTKPVLASESSMKSKIILSLGLIAVLAGCGNSTGSGVSVTVPSDSPVASTGLIYTNPTVSINWRLLKDPSSTPSHLVLNLVGPDNAVARGAGFNLQKSNCIKFSKSDSGAYATDMGVFQLMGTGYSPNLNEPYAGTPADPILFVSAPIKGGAVLSTGIYQKDRANPAVPVNQPLVQVAIDLDTSAPNCNSGTIVGLSVIKANIIPDDIGGMDYQLSADTVNKSKMQTIAVDVGTLVTK